MNIDILKEYVDTHPLRAYLTTEIMSGLLSFRVSYHLDSDPYSTQTVPLANKFTIDPRVAFDAYRIVECDREFFIGWDMGFSVYDYIKQRDNLTCQYCGEKNSDFHVDHVNPKSATKGFRILPEGWIFESPFNLLLACKSCNLSKGSRDLDWMRGHLLKKNVKINWSGMDNKVKIGIENIIAYGSTYDFNRQYV